MKGRMFGLVGTVAILLLASGCTAEDKAPQLETLMDKVSYSIGLNIGRDFKAQAIEVDPALMLRGVKDALQEAAPLLTDEQMQETLTAFQQEMISRQEAKAEEESQKNREAGSAFLAENGQAEGVVTLESGLQYKVIEEGSGQSPQASDSVTVHYRGTLIDGSEFDSSYERGTPATFPVGGVIAGWTEALQLMKEGAKWQLVIPSELAYGERGAGPLIGPNATLVFDVELISIN